VCVCEVTRQFTMPGFLSRIFRRRAVSASKVTKGVNGVDVTSNGTHQVVQIDPWEKTSVRREEVVDLLKACCDELKLRGILLFRHGGINTIGLDTPLFLLRSVLRPIYRLLKLLFVATFRGER